MRVGSGGYIARGSYLLIAIFLMAAVSPAVASAQSCENTHMQWRSGGQSYIANYWHSGGSVTCQVLGSNVSGCVIPPGGPSGTTEATCAQWCEDSVPTGLESDYQKFSYSSFEGVCQCGWDNNPLGNPANTQFFTCAKPVAAAVPALSRWPLALLAIALMGSAGWAYRRRDVTPF